MTEPKDWNESEAAQADAAQGGAPERPSGGQGSPRDETRQLEADARLLEPQGKMTESEPAASQSVPPKGKAADFLMQQNHRREETEDPRQRAAHQKNWQKFVEPPQGQREYHDFPAYFFAGFWIRSFAYFVDVVSVALITNLLLDKLLGRVGLEAAGNFSLYGVLGLGIYLAYFILMTKLTDGQTLGKMIFGIQVVCFKEEHLSWSTVLIREGACRFILKSGLFLLGYLPAAFTPAKQHLGDFLSDTSVVTLNSIKAYNGVKF